MGFVAVFSGILASFFAWLLVGFIIRPNIGLSKTISKGKALIEDGWIYRVKVTNKSWFFNVYDINLKGRVTIYDLEKDNPDAPRTFIINIGSGSAPYISSRIQEKQGKGRSYKDFIIKVPNAKKSEKTGDDKGQLLKLYNKLHPDQQLDKIFIEDVLSINDSAKLEISVTCTHEFSGSRRVITETYRKNSIPPNDIQIVENTGEED